MFSRSIEVAKKYYAEFQKQLTDAPSDKKHKIALIYSFGVNEEEIDGMILWESQGVFGLITNEVLRNLVTRYETARSIDEFYPRTKTPANLTNLSWNQCIMVPQEVARVLLSAPHEQANNLRDSKTAAKTPDKDHAEHQ